MPTPDILPSRRDFLGGSAALIAAAAFQGTAHAAAPPTPGMPPRSIHPYPNKIAWGNGTFALTGRATLAVGRNADVGAIATLREMWGRFTYGAVDLAIVPNASLKAREFTFAGGKPPQRDENASYALTVNESGIAANAVDPAALRHAWFTLLQLLDADDAPGGGLSFAAPHVEIQDWPALGFRGLHLCVFHDSPPHMIEKAVRLAAFFKFTHVIIEFWGMLQLEALKELSWPEAWTKSQAGKLISAARGMGLEVIPMFNCWGHAAGSRIAFGRHVVLDQNPRLASLFEPDGWTWCITNPRSQELIRRVCDELMEFAGPGQYFHIGCDEAYSHATCDRCRQNDRVQLFADHVNNLAAHIEKRGRRAMMWGDALLERKKWPEGFAANGTPGLPTHLALGRISRKIIINDWQYDIHGEIPTLPHFRDQGFETIGCAFNSGLNNRAMTRAVIASQSKGLLMTTWHHLAKSIPMLHVTAACMWSKDQAALALPQAEGSLARAATATILRKLVPAEARFERAGWNPYEQPAETD